jgi:hypothetical protein
MGVGVDRFKEKYREQKYPIVIKIKPYLFLSIAIDRKVR